VRPDFSLLRLTGTVGAGPKYGLTRSESGNPLRQRAPFGNVYSRANAHFGFNLPCGFAEVVPIFAAC